MIRERRSPVPFFLWRTLLFVATLAIPRTQAIAQALPGWNVVPPPPKLGTGTGAHQAKQSGPSADAAYDVVTREYLTWDCVAATWKNQAGQPLGFAGVRTATGEIIPPPPIIAGNQSQQSPDSPARATVSGTAQNLIWDSEGKTWRDQQTRLAYGFDGRLIHDVCPRTPKSAIRPLPTYSTEAGSFVVSVDFATFNFTKWKAVSGGGSTVVSNVATSTALGFDTYVGLKLPRLPIYGMAGGYYAGGLKNDAVLTNGRRVHNDVIDYGLGGGLRFVAGSRRVTPWASLAALYEWNKGDYTEFDRSNALVLSETRRHGSWTGSYGLGATYWVGSHFGLDFGASYNGQFDVSNADENIKFSVGLMWSGP